MSYTIGIDLGGSCVKAVVVTPDGKTLAKHHLPFDAAADMEWADHLRELVRSIEEEQGGRPEHIGFSAPGLAAPDGSCITHMPVRLEGLVGLNWQKFFDIGKAIPVLNDGHAALLGEAWLGAAKGFQTVILLTLGTGVGGAALVEGKKEIDAMVAYLQQLGTLVQARR